MNADLEREPEYPRRMHEIVEQKRDALLALCRRHRLRRLDLFGSAATGSFEPGSSDLDFLVELQELEPAAYPETYFRLLADLEDLFECPVDLIVESAVTNPYFKESIERTRTRLVAA